MDLWIEFRKPVRGGKGSFLTTSTRAAINMVPRRFAVVVLRPVAALVVTGRPGAVEALRRPLVVERLRIRPRLQRRAVVRADLGVGIVAAGSSGAARAAAAIAGAGLLVRYHHSLATREAAGGISWRTTQAATRRAWAKHILATKEYLYALHAMRNAMMLNQLFTSTVVSLFTVTVGFFYTVLKRQFGELGAGDDHANASGADVARPHNNAPLYPRTTQGGLCLYGVR